MLCSFTASPSRTITAPGSYTSTRPGVTASWSGGYSVGNFAAGFLADSYGFGVAFWVAAVFPLLAIVAHPHVQPPPVPMTAATRTQRAPLRLMLRADVRAVPLLAFSIYFVNSLLATLFPLYVLAIGETLALAGTAAGLHQTRMERFLAAGGQTRAGEASNFAALLDAMRD